MGKFLAVFFVMGIKTLSGFSSLVSSYISLRRAADVLLQALLDLGVPAIRAGRPAAISVSVRHRSAVALAEKMPQVLHLRKQLSATASGSRNINNRSKVQ